MTGYRITIEPLDDESALLGFKYGFIFEPGEDPDWDDIQLELGSILSHTIQQHEED